MGQNQKNTQEPDMNQLRKVRREKLAELQQNGRDPFQITKFNQTHHSLEVKDLYEAHEAEILKDHQQPNVEGMDEEQAKEALKNDYEERRSIMDASPIHVAIAGRMMFKRVMGKASFCNIQDLQGNIQVYVARDAIGTDAYADFKKSDIGDIFGLEGFAFRTRTGEISIHAEKMTLLSKSLQMLPEKFHGLTDTDTRYRQRYVDLIMNADSKDTFIKRSKILAAIRKYLSGEGFMEVETPMLVANAGGAAARPFETHFNALNEDLKLRISLELYLKRLIVGGLEKVYEIGRVFRNEGLDTRHNPEFTLMELYQAYTDYNGMMDLTENLYRHVAQEVLGTTKIVYNGVEMDLGKPFERITMLDAVKKYSGVDFNEIHTQEEARAAGVDGFLPKPLYRTAVYEEISRELKEREGRQIQGKAKQKLLSGKKILLAEDNDINRDIAKELLELQGATVIACEDGKQALQAFQNSGIREYDAILLDIRMPVLDGYETAGRIRALNRKDAVIIPMIAVTAHAFSGDVTAALRAGMNAHVSKPLDIAELCDKLIKEMERAESEYIRSGVAKNDR